ncbi:hypothetical protein MOQ72_42230 [Saccharopolyspora sp. K220]|uniref:hypothetical protein n=1 Tax=Saccharopolyspora soli TaxID=2926618 RepID=UPI001F570A39|nr:hypothetical protein [Saccharopolyspora soli]MCI2424037.1 hypothetical protein [Saccharopolyspora soli]
MHEMLVQTFPEPRPVLVGMRDIVVIVPTALADINCRALVPDDAFRLRDTEGRTPAGAEPVSVP